MTIHSPYLSPYLLGEGLNEIIESVIVLLRKHSKGFDAIAFRGASGALVAPAVAARLHKSLILVRKPEENAHSRMLVEGPTEIVRYVIVDDLIISGATIREIKRVVKLFSPYSKCVGIVEYNELRHGLVDPSRRSSYDGVPILTGAKPWKLDEAPLPIIARFDPFMPGEQSYEAPGSWIPVAA